MQIPVIRGTIERRILANYRINAEVMARLLPSPFRPKLVDGWAIGGICLIRLKSIRPWFIPFQWGIASENVAHRIAVQWDVDGRCQEGVYIPRRDTNSRLNAWAAGTLFPGLSHYATFTVQESDGHYSVDLKSKDGETRVFVSGTVARKLPSSSVFPSVSDASKFFEAGSLGYSTTKDKSRFDGIELHCNNWHVEPLEIDRIESSYFDHMSHFPTGSVEFDCALLMRDIHHEWHSRNSLCCQTRLGQE